MAVDWGQALMAGAGAGLSAYGGQQLKQQDDQRWLEKQQQLMAMKAKADAEREQYLLSLKAPEQRKVNTTDAAGKPVVRADEWVVKDGKGSWQNVGETPDINFERLDETQRHNTETEQLRSAADQARADAAAGRLDLARERLANAKSGGGHGKLIRKVDANGQGVYGEVKDGVFHPVEDEEGNPVTTQAWRQRTGVTNTVELRNGDKYRTKPADKIGPAYPASQFDDRPDVSMMPSTKTSPQITVVDPSEQAPLSQFAPKSAAQPAQQAGSSPNNPIPYQAGMPKPPSGTYVRKPDGTVVRVP